MDQLNKTLQRHFFEIQDPSFTCPELLFPPPNISIYHLELKSLPRWTIIAEHKDKTMKYINSFIYKPGNYLLLLAHLSNMVFAGSLNAETTEKQTINFTLSGIDGSKNYTETVCPGFNMCFDLFSGAQDKSKKLTLIYDGNLPGSSFTTNFEKQPTGHICWTPEAKDARVNPYEFSISVVDEEDPSISTTFHYSITVPLIKVDIATTDITCYGNSDGIAIASVTGGSGNYIYQWLNHENNSSSIDGLGAGDITVQVMDDFGCEATATKRILSPQPLVLDVISEHAICASKGGQAEVLASGGTMPYTYSWLPGDETNYRIENLPSGVYTAVVTDANGCAAYKQVNISTILPAESAAERKEMVAGETNMTNVLIYPNPASDQFTVKNISESTVSISIISSLGQEVYHTINVPANLSVSIPMDDQAKGIYLVKVQRQATIEMVRLVKE